ncbi:Mitochondrial protein Pet127 [Microdochium nivale]|nr:Mitochondrial protein Pet127 [Microdochium nivale]
MLRLTTRSARGASPAYMRNACITSQHVLRHSPAWSSIPPGQLQHTRLLRSSSRKHDEAQQNQQSIEPAPNGDDGDAIPDLLPETGKKSKAGTTAKGKAKASQSKETKTRKSSSTASKAKPVTPVLQGAIDTFKKVLADQKIDLAHLTQMLGQETSPTKRKKAEKKEKVKKKIKGAKQEDADSAAVAEGTSRDKESSGLVLEKGLKRAAALKARKAALEAHVAARKADKQARRRASKNPAPEPLFESGAEAGIGGSRSHVLGTPLGATTTSTKSKSKRDTKAAELSISTIESAGLELTPIDKVAVPVPRLAHGLDRVLFNPGVYFLQDPRSRVFNFDPYLANIMPIKEFDFNALKQYITSSKDTTLIAKAKAYKKKYTGSTSSMTAMLSHFHYLLSSWRPVNGRMMSAEFKPDSTRFTRLTRAPAAIFLHWKDGCYAIDADKEFDSANILSMLGKSMEKLLTLPKHKFEKYRHVNSDQISEEERNAEEAFHYTGFKDFMMRSQLDAYDKRIPGTGMFDLKTRAVVSIRMDAQNFHKGVGYEIRQRFGQWESFEREYYDMIRSAFLKYSLQVRMGRMDGIYVAFHNTQRIFGFQYISISEMDNCLHGTSNTTLGDQEYKLSLTLLNQLLDRATKRWPEQSLRLHFETRESVVAPFLYFFARPVKDGDIEAVQNAGKAQVEAFERSILGLNKKVDGDEAKADETADDSALVSQKESEEVVEEGEEVSSDADADAQRLVVWEEVQQMVEDAMSDEEQGMSSVREAIYNALEESSLLGVEADSDARQYIDALIAAITGVQPENTQEAKNDMSEEQQDVDIVVTSTETTSPASELADVDDTTPTTTEHHERAVEPSDVVEDSPETIAVADDISTVSTEELVTAGEDVNDIKPVLQTRPSMAPLKNFITLSAQRIQERPAAEAGNDGSDEDLSKLKVFEKILRQMISEAKAGESMAERTGSLSDVEKPEYEDVIFEDASVETPGVEEEDEGNNLTGGESIDPEEQFDLLGMVLTIKNKVNGEYVDRPNDLSSSDKWDVEYNIEELPTERAHRLYENCQERRRTIFQATREKTDFESIFGGAMARSTRKGAEFRRKEMARAKKHPVHVYDVRHPLTYRSAFGNAEHSAAAAAAAAAGSGSNTSSAALPSKASGGAVITRRKRRSLRKRSTETPAAMPTSPADKAQED